MVSICKQWSHHCKCICNYSTLLYALYFVTMKIVIQIERELYIKEIEGNNFCQIRKGWKTGQNVVGFAAPLSCRGGLWWRGCCALCRPIKVPLRKSVSLCTDNNWTTKGVFRLIVDENVVKVVGWFGQRRCGGCGGNNSHLKRRISGDTLRLLL